MASFTAKYTVIRLVNRHSRHQLPTQLPDSWSMMIQAVADQSPKAKLVTGELELFPLTDAEAAEFKIGQAVTVTVSGD